MLDPRESHPLPALTLDIDDTLAYGVVPVHLGFYNRVLDLGLSSQEIATAGLTYAKTFDVPEIVAFREHNEARFQEVRAEIRTSAEVHLALEAVPLSQDRVSALVKRGVFDFRGYYSVRPHEIEAATQAWLANKDFPRPDDVVICDSHVDKVKRILDNLVITDDVSSKLVDDQLVALIDDSLPQLFEASHEVGEIDEAYLAALGRLLIVGFGRSESPTHYPDINLHTLTLPSWEQTHADQLLTDIAALCQAA